MSRAIRLSAALALALLAPAARAEVLADSTVREAWRLPNGLEVRTLHVPGAAGVAVTVAYRAGAGYEPAQKEGWSDLLAEVHFTAAAGDVPERTREEMSSLRPLGWESRPGQRLVRFTEIASTTQFPGVLQQVARRMSGVTVDDAVVQRALASVRRDRGLHYFGDPADVLYWRVGAVARGWSDEQLVRATSLAHLEKTTAREVNPWLQRWYQPGNASLAIAGDLSGVDVRALVGTLFGALPGAGAMPDTVRFEPQPGRRVVPWRDLGSPAGVVAARAPALSDTLHPAFYLTMLISGPALSYSWGKPTPPLRTRFQYSLLDEPELVRFYPAIAPDVDDTERLAGSLYEMLMVVGGQQMVREMMERVRRNVRWLLGGTLPPDVRQRLGTDPAALGTLSANQATRAAWRGDAFWTEYLARFDRASLGHNFFYERLADHQNQVVLLLTPRR